MIRVLVEITDDSNPAKHRHYVQVEYRYYGDATAYMLGRLFGDAVDGVQANLLHIDGEESLINGLISNLPGDFIETNLAQ